MKARQINAIAVVVLLGIATQGICGTPKSSNDSVSIKGIPRIIHYTKNEFNGDSQFWAMAQDPEGVLYFGNNDGALIFNGEEWQTVKLPNSSSIRSLTVSSDGAIYAGGFNELGVIKKDEFGKYYYTSLIHLLRPEDRNLENIWQVHQVQGHMVFRSYKMLIAIANGKAVTLPASDAFRFSTVVHDTLYVIDREGLKSVDLNSFEFVHQLRLTDIGNEELVSLLPGFDKNELLAITKQGSFFKFYPKTGEVRFWQKFIREDSKNLVTCAIKASTGNYYLGTLSTRIISLDAAGHRISSEGFPDLQDNTVLNLFESREGNIWALLNNGLDCIDVTSPVSLLFENASIYDVLMEGERMYLATNQGMFVSTFTGRPAHMSTVDFDKISGLEGQAWAIHRFEGRIVCSHDRGIFILSETGFRKVPGISGVWKIIPVSEGSGKYLVCTYDGIWLMTYEGSAGFVLQHKLEGFNESSRDILQGDDPGIFWVCHGYKGVFRIKIDDQLRRVVSVEHFKDQNGLPSPFNVNVARWNKEIVFTTNNGIFTYDNASNKFKPHTFLTDLLGDELNVRKLLQHGDRTWFVHDNEVGYFMTHDEKPKLEKGLFLQLKGSLNASMECIVPVGSSNVLIGTNTGLYAFDLNYNATPGTARTMITRVSYRYASAESFCPLQTSDDLRQKLPYKTSGILFHFSAPAFRDKLNVQFSYLLEDVDDEWSPWQVDPVKEYSMLRPGKYVFRVRARSLLGESAAEARYYLEILPLWYQTAWAYFLYSIAGALMVAGTIILIGRKIRKEREKTQSEEREKREVLELQLQRIKLEREKEEILKDKDLLEEDVIHKSKELANYTMLLVKKRELLSEIQEELKGVKESLRSDAARQKLRDLLKKISANLADEEHIQVFEANFERVHHEFFTGLKTSFPDLTQKELRLCAFVRMNLTNKEIASILNISVRGVETARYRLRKRLSLNHEEDMAGFLEKLSSSVGEPVHLDEEEVPDKV